MKSATGTYLAPAANKTFAMFRKTLEQTQTHRTHQERSRKRPVYGIRWPVTTMDDSGTAPSVCSLPSVDSARATELLRCEPEDHPHRQDRDQERPERVAGGVGGAVEGQEHEHGAEGEQSCRRHEEDCAPTHVGNRSRELTARRNWTGTRHTVLPELGGRLHDDGEVVLDEFLVAYPMPGSVAEGLARLEPGLAQGARMSAGSRA
jgi:hypothetical protein